MPLQLEDVEGEEEEEVRHFDLFLVLYAPKRYPFLTGHHEAGSQGRGTLQ